MTHDNARTYFFEQLPLVRNTEELLRLTFWVLPHLRPKEERPLGDIETIQLQLQLECSTYPKDNIRVWWHCTNRNIAGQLKALEPVYTDGSSGPHFCSGLTPKMSLAHGPSPHAAGLSLGVYAAEHAKAKTALLAATDMVEWWTTFLEHTPLWMRTAYNWHKPTAEQETVLQKARASMLEHVPELVMNTKIGYNNSNGDVRVSYQPTRSGNKKPEGVQSAPYWTALVAGQTMLGIGHECKFSGLGPITAGVQNNVRELCAIVCSLRGWDEMNDMAVAQAMSRARSLRQNPPTALPLPELDAPGA